MDISTGARFKGALSKPAVFSTASKTTARNHGNNHPPTFNGSIGNQELTLLLPRGPSALLRFEGEPATDQDGDDISYRFAFAVPGVSGIQTPSEALLRITRDGNSFAFQGNGDIAPARFTSVYGEMPIFPPCRPQSTQAMEPLKAIPRSLTCTWSTTVRPSFRLRQNT